MQHSKEILAERMSLKPAFDQVDMVEQLILEAIQKGASDIHFEPYADEYRIRYRLDGLLSLAYSLSPECRERMTARLKIIGSLDPLEKRLPQDGRIRPAFLKEASLDLRISTCPTAFGEKIVLRVLNTGTLVTEIEKLGMEEQEQRLFKKYLSKPQGLILVTGPTGSGKTLTLYAALHFLNAIKRNIMTAEDPIEISMKGINQVNIHPKIGLDFPTLLRSFLRQDPDILMIGEIRDLETAEIAFRAAHTGHLVLSTLHTNSAIETLSRLKDFNIPNYNIAASIELVVAQRLVRKLCPECKEKEGDYFKAKGCLACHQGYKDRIGLFEFLPFSQSLRELLRQKNGRHLWIKEAEALRSRSLYQAGLAKVNLGLTTMEEVERVTMD